MVRAFAVCAVILAVRVASAQTATPTTVTDIKSNPEPTIAAADGAAISACDQHECPAPSADTAAEKPSDDHALLRQKLAEMNCLQSEIDALRVATGTPQQILVKVKAVEVSRSKLKALGIDAAELCGEKQNGNSIVKTIDHLQQNNAARVLAEPNLVVTCGRPASFNVGGEVPLPTLPGSKQAAEFKQFGTQVDVLATAQGDSRVRLHIRARVSELDYGKQAEIAGVTVPALAVRQIDSDLDLKLGQTGVLSGLVQQRTERHKLQNQVVDHVEEIELLFLVTPEAVAPMDVATHEGTDAAAYRTATSDSEERPNERSLRVTTPFTPR